MHFIASRSPTGPERSTNSEHLGAALPVWCSSGCVMASRPPSLRCCRPRAAAGWRNLPRSRQPAVVAAAEIVNVCLRRGYSPMLSRRRPGVIGPRLARRWYVGAGILTPRRGKRRRPGQASTRRQRDDATVQVAVSKWPAAQMRPGSIRVAVVIAGDVPELFQRFRPAQRAAGAQGRDRRAPRQRRRCPREPRERCARSCRVDRHSRGRYRSRSRSSRARWPAHGFSPSSVSLPQIMHSPVATGWPAGWIRCWVTLRCSPPSKLARISSKSIGAPRVGSRRPSSRQRRQSFEP